MQISYEVGAQLNHVNIRLGKSDSRALTNDVLRSSSKCVGQLVKRAVKPISAHVS